MALQLEVGKYYRTRDGRKVGPLTHHPDEQESYHWQARGCDLNGTDAAWFDCGAVYSTRTSPYDLISEWHTTTLPAQPPMTFYPLQRMIDCDDLPVTRQEAKEMMRAIRELYAKMEGK